MIQKTINLWQKMLAKYIAPPSRMSVSEWSDTYRYLSNYAVEPGKWKTDRAPYQKAIMDAFTTEGVSRVVAKLSVQLGKSEILNNVLGRFIHLDPCPILLVQPADQDAQDYSKESLAPTVAVTPVLKELVSDPKAKDSSNTILRKHFPGGYLAIVGSNSPKNLARRTIKLLLLDELDSFEESSGTEGDPLALAIKRTSNVFDAIVGIFSSPKGSESRIDAEYSLGSQEEWRHRCPCCDEWHWVTLQNMHYEYKTYEVKGKKAYKIESVVWRCPDCGKQFTEQQMREAEQGYIAQNPEIEHIRSFRVNSFASPWMAWETMIMEYLEADGDPEKLKVFVNTRLCELYEEKGEIKDENILLNRREEYGAEVPHEVLLLTASVDTQDNRLEYEICGWGDGEECWGIQKGIVIGVPDQKSTWDELDTHLDRIYYKDNRTGLRVARTFIDSGGHYTEEVYRYCLRNKSKQRIAIKGHRLPGVPLLYKLANAKDYAVTLVLLGVSEGKQYVMQRLIQIDQPGPKYFHFPKDDQRGYDQIYFRGLIAERLMPKNVRGKIVRVWQNVSKDKRNEPLDLRVYNLACLHSINPDWEAFKRAVFGDEKGVKPLEKPQKAAKKQYGCVKKSQVSV